MSRLFATLLVCGFAVGCGGGISTGTVSGVISVDGKPLDNASVTFTPAATGNDVHTSNGRTDANGNYTLSITATGQSGAAVGNNKVTIAFIGEETDSDVGDPNATNPVPAHDLSFDVKSGSNKADFDLKSK